MENSTSDSPILRLPAELRNRIFELALPSDERIGCDHEHNREIDVYKVQGVTISSKTIITFGPPPQPGILKACRQIRLETLPVYYRNNIFVWEASGLKSVSLKEWLDVMRSGDRPPLNYMRRLEIVRQSVSCLDHEWHAFFSEPVFGIIFKDRKAEVIIGKEALRYGAGEHYATIIKDAKDTLKMLWHAGIHIGAAKWSNEIWAYY